MDVMNVTGPDRSAHFSVPADRKPQQFPVSCYETGGAIRGPELRTDKGLISLSNPKDEADT